jgi:hypothetical protein
MAKLIQVKSEIVINKISYPVGEVLSISEELFVELGDKVVETKPKAESKK